MKKGGKGKKFEGVMEESFNRVKDAQFIRLKDDNRGYKGVANPCDFLVYHKPHLYAIECKSVHGNTLSIFSNDPEKCYGLITNKQWESLLEMSTIKGVFAGVVCWWVIHDVTLFIPIQMLEAMRNDGAKSIRYDCDIYTDDNGKIYHATEIFGKKKRVYFEYDMQKFLDEMEGTK